jgi:hydroxyacylglutathione hydrolase
VIVERATNDAYRSNCYLVLDEPGGAAVIVDAGSPVEPLVEAAERHGVTPSLVLLTHHHGDHVDGIGTLTRRWPDTPVVIHELERELVPGATATITPGKEIVVGSLQIRPLHTPGHTQGMVSFLIGDREESAVFTGDTLFRGSVGGVRAPGHDTYQALKDSIMGTLMELPKQTVVRPGHSGSTTVGTEWETNPFVRIWRGVDREGAEPCLALGEPATLVLLARDYDDGTKAWVRWPDGRDDIVPGSRVQRLD